MMAVLEALLSVIGLGLLILLALRALSDKPIEPPPVEDAAFPYREGLHAAVRMRRVAQDLEQQIYAAAAQQIDADAERSGTGTAERQ